MTRTPKLTRRQAAIITCATGTNMQVMGISSAQELMEELLGEPIFTHEIPERMDEIKAKVQPLLQEIGYDEAADPEPWQEPAARAASILRGAIDRERLRSILTKLDDDLQEHGYAKSGKLRRLVAEAHACVQEGQP